MRKINLPIEDMIEKYENFESSMDIAKYYNVSQSTVCRNLEKYIKFREIGWAAKKYSVDETYFDNIDSEDKAYWLGIFLTDGNTSGGVRLNLQTGDEGHIKKFQNNIGSNHPIRRVQEGTNGTSCLHIGNKHLVSVLREKGIIPHDKKVFNVDSFLEKHYWRGAIDGDGNVFKKGLMIGICGTEETCNKFREFCLKIVKSNAQVKNIKKNLWHFRLHGLIIIPVCKVLYENSTVYLERKYKTYLELISKDLTIKSCRICKITKKINKENWVLSKNDYPMFGTCRECNKKNLQEMGLKRKQKHIQTKYREGDKCERCEDNLINTNINYQFKLIYVGCKNCGYKAGSYHFLKNII